MQVLTTFYILVLSLYSFSCFGVGDDTFDWWKDENNILPSEEFAYFRQSKSRTSLENVQNESPAPNITPTHRTTSSQSSKAQDYHSRKKEYWKQRRLHIMHKDPARHKKSLERRRELNKGISAEKREARLAVRRRQWEEKKMQQRPLTYEAFINEKERKKIVNHRYRTNLKAKAEGVSSHCIAFALDHANCTADIAPSDLVGCLHLMFAIILLIVLLFDHHACNMIRLIYVLLLALTYVNCVKDDIFNWLQDDDNIVSSKDLAIIKRTQKEQEEERGRHTSSLSGATNVPSSVGARNQSPQIASSVQQEAKDQTIKGRKKEYSSIAEQKRKYRLHVKQNICLHRIRFNMPEKKKDETLEEEKHMQI
ncbi:uncharacterized protein FA14DRAFT_157615 [Meira miltonrushii]|uniref:BZIP domain-containing protein n=1 Tax=Meira miltonrushii TaxID=1280837 RepID=A0A316V9S5_9BASI|nr:uncharacterized protein FA14DRAFT_157615 [Meira miltonrushii]PWN32923.1 hypothetical protein FA14DRAFT_157615 [Meira miltonrushii]